MRPAAAADEIPMSPRLKLGVVFSSMLLTLMLVVGAVMGKSEEKDSAYRPLAVYTEVLARIKSDYVEEPDIEKVTRGALQGLVEYLDPMSSYLSKEQYEEYLERKGDSVDDGQGWSTGLITHKRGNYTAVIGVLPGSAADKAGIKPGDLIEAIDDRSTRLMPPALLYARLGGQEGEPVRILVRSSSNYDDPVEHRLVRTEPAFPEIEREMIEGSIGVITAKSLDSDRVEQIGKAVKALEKQGATSLILDLRGNAVGSSDSGLRLADLFLSEGRLATLKGQNSPERTFDATPKSTVTELPLVVLVDRPTSRGAEIAAAALADNDRAEVIGERTYGLAAEQTTLELEDGAALLLSTAKYYRGDGEPLHDDGMTPEHSVEPADLRRFRDPENPTPEAEREDPFVQKAVEILQG